MTRDDIIRMAREAGLRREQHNLMSSPVQHRFSYDGYEENLERFAALVAAAEREACAKVCEGRVGGSAQANEWWVGFRSAMKQCAAAIRARSNK